MAARGRSEEVHLAAEESAAAAHSMEAVPPEAAGSTAGGPQVAVSMEEEEEGSAGATAAAVVVRSLSFKNWRQALKLVPKTSVLDVRGYGFWDKLELYLLRFGVDSLAA